MKKNKSLIFLFAYNAASIIALCGFCSCGNQEGDIKKKLEEANNKAEKFQSGFNRLQKENKELQDKFDIIEEKNKDFEVLCSERRRFYELQVLFKRKEELIAKKVTTPLTPPEITELEALEKEKFDLVKDRKDMLDREDMAFATIVKKNKKGK